MKTYLPKFYHILTGIIFMISLVFGLYLFLICYLMIYLFAFFLLRRELKSFKENPSIKNGVLFSPFNGKVVSIRHHQDHAFVGKDLIEIRIKVPWWKDSGIYLPETSEIDKVDVKRGNSFFYLGREKLREQKDEIFSGLIITLKPVSGHKIAMQFVKCNSNLWPETSVIPGDRGKRHVNIGHFPLGGTVLLYLPKNYEILINEGDEVVACETLLGGAPE